MRLTSLKGKPKMTKTISMLFFIVFFAGTTMAVEPMALTEVKPGPDETHHIEVKPESAEGYRIPYMDVFVLIVDEQTKDEETFALHPMFSGNFHYGVNVSLKPGKYLLKFRLAPPSFVRGENRKAQWLERIDAEFPFDSSIKFEKSIRIGQTKTNDMRIIFEAEHAEPMFVPGGAGHEHHH
jgi:hypothetical protein